MGYCVVICVDIMLNILENMPLYGMDDNILKGVCMFGAVKTKTDNCQHFYREIT